MSVVREYADQPQTIPEVWLEARLPGVEAQEQDFIGDAAGFDASGNPLFGAVFEAFPVDFGCRARLAAERDNLIDYIWLALKSLVNPATNARWVQELYVRRGIEVSGGPWILSAPAQPTTRAGQLYEGLGRLTVRTSVAANVIYQPVTTIAILPTATVSVPLGLG